ncbi:hypothetical protein DFH07DRAFT_1065630 [Mycena maculata]|uniref:Uncharacterized protein n=1 Tax=Mycena maculata TaxID=230809 RepID=A0AAD7MTH5_9AGAR|nr:hypothetical protein DFH07DRAFT_1065630 [Mycena maculata]
MDFPFDLEREIFETAAEVNPAVIPNLLLVSHRVHQWIEKIRYRTFTSERHRSASRVSLLRNVIQSKSKSPSFLHDHVRQLFIDHLLPNLDVDELNEILEACSGIRFLVLFQASAPSILPALGAMKPRRFCIFLAALFKGIPSMDLAHAAFSCVTHLEIFETVETLLRNLPSFTWSTLSLLPVLTHLGVYKLDSLAVSTEILASCTQLAVLVAIYNTPSDFNELLSIDERRFVAILLSDDDYEKDWLTGTRGGLDFWARADSFVAKKRRREIDPDSRCWILPEDGI